MERDEGLISGRGRGAPVAALVTVLVLALVAWLVFGRDPGSEAASPIGDSSSEQAIDDAESESTGGPDALAEPADTATADDAPAADDDAPGEATTTAPTSIPGDGPRASSSPTPAPSRSSAVPSPVANGGATDVGVTGSAVTIYVVQQEGGAVPREDPAGPAVRAFAAYVNEELGGVHGRRIEVVTRDNRMDAGQEASILREACAKAFAVVGSTSIPTGSGPSRPLDCELSDLRGATYTPEQRTAWPDRFSIKAHGSSEPSMSSWKQWADREPKAVAASAWVQGFGASAAHRDVVIRQSRALGYRWTQQHDGTLVTPVTYDQMVQQMRDGDVEFVHFDGGGPDLVRFGQAMERGNYEPTLFTVPAWAMDSGAVQFGEPGLEGVELAVDVIPWMERSSNPSMRRYETWLSRVDPGAAGSTEGALAWAAASVFVDVLRELGPDPTREDLVEALRGAADVTADGVIGARDRLAGEASSDCVAILRAVTRSFVRVEGKPGSFTCVAA